MRNDLSKQIPSLQPASMTTRGCPGQPVDKDVRASLALQGTVLPSIGDVCPGCRHGR